MNHPATFVLPLSASRVLDVLHSMFAIGELIAISQDEIAHVGNISEASVSRAMPILIEHGFLNREWDRSMNGGRGGYWLRLLPLPALEGSVVDPLADDRESCDPMPRMAFTASPCGTDQQLIPNAPPMVHDDLRIQEEESARSPLFERLIAQPSMSRSLATRIANHPIGTLAEFETDLKIAQTFAKSPFFFTVAKWRDGQRVIAPEVCYERPRSAAPTRARRRSQQNRPEHTADPVPQDDYAAIIAEWQRTEPLGPIAMRVPGQRGGAHGD